MRWSSSSFPLWMNFMTAYCSVLLLNSSKSAFSCCFFAYILLYSSSSKSLWACLRPSSSVMCFISTYAQLNRIRLMWWDWNTHSLDSWASLLMHSFCLSWLSWPNICFAHRRLNILAWLARSMQSCWVYSYPMLSIRSVPDVTMKHEANLKSSSRYYWMLYFWAILSMMWARIKFCRIHYLSNYRCGRNNRVTERFYSKIATFEWPF